MLKAGPVWALGAMSGTSLDGVDAAMLQTDGETIGKFGPHAYRAYDPQERAVLLAGLGCWQGDPAVEAVAEVVETAHAQLLSRFSGAAIVGFHGQTLAHDPAMGRTHQAGNGALLARVLGLPVVWDFRSSDVALGGQGAPLVPFYHHALARHLGQSEPLAFLNLGGVGNVTWVDPRIPEPSHPGAVLAFDTGPANAPLNDLIRRATGQPQDQGGRIAGAGTADTTFVADFLHQTYFHRIPPKSLDRDAFDFSALSGLPLADHARTLLACAAASVGAGLTHFPRPVTRLLVCGGGRRNPVMMQELRQRCGCAVQDVDDLGLDGDMIEAQAFAYLAVRVARGLPTSCPTTTGVRAAVGGGQISYP